MQGRAPRIEELVEHAATLERDTTLTVLTDQALERQLVTQTVRIAAETSRWLDLVAEVVIRGIWADQGARSPAAWLSWRLGVAPSTAREHVRVALRLRELPLIHGRFAAGTLSYSKVRALTRIAVPELEELLLTWSDQATGADLDRIAKGVVQARRAAADERSHDAEERSARFGLDVLIGDDGEVELRWRLDAADGMEVLSILDRLVELEDRAEEASRVGAGEDGPARADGPADVSANVDDDPAALPAPGPSLRQRQGQLLHHLLVAARDTTPPDTSGDDRHTLVIQVDAADLAPDPDAAPSRRVPIEVPGSRRARPSMSASVLRRLACDAGVVVVPTVDSATTGSRTPIDVGRRRRRPTAALRRALRLRDRSCRFPGCSTTRHLHAHHVVFWDKGGPTDLANLVLLCGSHHRQIHQPGWQLDWGANGSVIVRPAGVDGQPGRALAVAPQLPGLASARTPTLGSTGVPGDRGDVRATSHDAGMSGGATDAVTGGGCASAEAPAREPEGADTAALDPAREGASAEAPDRLAPQHWRADDPLQVDLLIAILQQELIQARGLELEQAA